MINRALLSLFSLASLVSGENVKLKKCFSNPSKSCTARGKNLIATYDHVYNEYFCSRRCLDFEDCQWWTFHDRSEDQFSNTCELFRNKCNPKPSKYSRYDARCGDSSTASTTIILGGKDNFGNFVRQIEAFDAEGPCEKADFIKGPLPRALTKIKHSTGTIDYINTIVSCGGESSNHTVSNECVIYDFNKYKWYIDTSVVPNMMEKRSDFTMVYAYGEIYAIGGNDGICNLNTMEIFNPMTRQWRSGPSMGSKRANHCAVRVDDSIIVTGGISNNYLAINSTLKYNVTTRQWSELPDMKIARMNHACAYDEKSMSVIVSGGQGREHKNVLKEVSRFNVSLSGFWIEDDVIPPLNEERTRHSIGVLNGTLIVIGGMGSSNILRSVEKYSSEEWMMASYEMVYGRIFFSTANVPSEMVVTGCHNKI